jgi:hypothetical protein
LATSLYVYWNERVGTVRPVASIRRTAGQPATLQAAFETFVTVKGSRRLPAAAFHVDAAVTRS